jgi:hypothetical protein
VFRTACRETGWPTGFDFSSRSQDVLVEVLASLVVPVISLTTIKLAVAYGWVLDAASTEVESLDAILFLKFNLLKEFNEVHQRGASLGKSTMLICPYSVGGS